MACASSGCLVSDPPDYGQTEKIPPVLLISQADPPSHALVVTPPEEPIKVSVPFRSEDAGEPVFSVGWLNYKLEEERQVGFDVDNPGTFDQVRTASFTWRAPAREDCYQFTLLVMHESDLINEEKKPVKDAEFGQISWWLIVGDSATLDDCPSITGGTP